MNAQISRLALVALILLSALIAARALQGSGAALAAPLALGQSVEDLKRVSFRLYDLRLY